MVVHLVVIHLHTELDAPIKTTGIMMNCLYTIRLRNYGIALSSAICVIVKYFGKLLLKTTFRSNTPYLLLIKTNHEKSVI